MTKPFPIEVGMQICVLPRGNARYMFKASAGPDGVENTPLPAEILSVGRVYFQVCITGHTLTRFRKDDFTSADKDENTRYEIFPSQEACKDYVARQKYFKEIRDMLNKAVWNLDMLSHITTRELETFLLRLKNEIPNEKEETEESSCSTL